MILSFNAIYFLRFSKSSITSVVEKITRTQNEYGKKTVKKSETGRHNFIQYKSLKIFLRNFILSASNLTYYNLGRAYFFQPYLILLIQTILQSGRNNNFKACS